MMKKAMAVCWLTLIATPALGQSVVANWDQVTLDVNNQSETIRGYQVHYGTQQGGPYTLGFSQEVTGLTVQIDNLSNGQTYYFVVNAIDAAGNVSANSIEASYVVPVENCSNGVDDDRDGKTDCSDSECASEPAPSCPLQLGVCQGSVKRCTASSGQWLDCNAASYGSDYQVDETRCDDKDNDCDSQTDEMPGPLCPLQLGVCAGSRQRCDGAGGFSPCDDSIYGADYEEGAETKCDDLDNDCDGSTDEGLANCCTDGETNPCSTDEGECVAGTQTCLNQTWGACNGVLPVAETCDGKDNDCNAETDEAEDLTPPTCEKQQGVCAGSVKRCGGTQGWLVCGVQEYGNDYQEAETLCDNKDNDCDQVTDPVAVCSGEDGGPDGGQDAGSDPGSDNGSSDSGADSGADNVGPQVDNQDLAFEGSCGCGSNASDGMMWLLLVLFGMVQRYRSLKALGE